MVTFNKNSDAVLLVGEGAQAVGDGLYILLGQGHSFVAETDVGLVVVDAGPGGDVTRGMIKALREHSQAPIHALVHSHGHIGYNGGVPLWLQHCSERGDPEPRRIAQRNLQRRHDRYRETMALQCRMAELQFRRPDGAFGNRFEPHDPSEWFDERLVIGSGKRRIELLWTPSETDDTISVWVPEQRVLYGGPAVIDSIPNIGTPLRTLRDTVRWAGTLEAMAALQPVRVVREFGPSVEGAEQVQQVLLHTARALRWLRAEVVQLLNEGLNLQQILARMHYPDELFDVTWMRPTYGDPSYIVRDIVRSESGWWDRNPTSLHPEPPDAVAAALANAVTDKAAVIAQASQLVENGSLQLALHVIDLLATAAGDAPELAQARALKAQWLRLRSEQIPSYVSSSLYLGCAEMIETGQTHRFGVV